MIHSEPMLSRFINRIFCQIYLLISFFFILSGVFLLLLSSTKKHELILYWMPQCPYGIMALKKALFVCNQNPGKIELKLRYIADDAFASASLKQVEAPSVQAAGCDGSMALPNSLEKPVLGRFTSLHGNDEVNEGMRQTYISAHWPIKWNKYIQRYADKPKENWIDRCAAVGIDSTSLEQKTPSQSNVIEYAKSLADSRKKGIAISPSLFFDGTRITCPTSDYGCIEDLFAKTLNSPETSPNIKQKIYLILPSNSEACSVVNWQGILAPWLDHLEVVSVDLEEITSQKLLLDVQPKAFPILAIPSEVLKEKWAMSMEENLPLRAHGDFFYLSLDNTYIPFRLYGHVKYDVSGVHCVVNHKLSAILLQRFGYINEAKTEYWRAFALNNNDAQVCNNLGVLLYETTGYEDLGAMLFLRSLNIKPNDEFALLNLSNHFFHIGNKDLGEKYMSRYAWALAANHQFDKALAAFFKSYALAPQDYWVNKGLGWSLTELNRPKEALQYLKFCNSVRNDDSDVWLLLGGIYFRLGDFSNSESDYIRSLQMTRLSPDAFHNLLYLYEKEGKWGEILQASKDGVQDWVISVYVAEALWETGKKNEAITHLLSLKQHEPSSRLKTSYLLAIYSAEQKNRDLALEEIVGFCEELKKNGEDSSQYCYDLANEALQMHRNDLANQCLGFVLSRHPGDPQLHIILAKEYHLEGSSDKEYLELQLAREFGG